MIIFCKKCLTNLDSAQKNLEFRIFRILEFQKLKFQNSPKIFFNL